MLKTDRDLWFLKIDRFSSGNVNMAKISERLLSTNMLLEKRQDSFDPQRVNLFGEDSICMVKLLGTPRVIVFSFFFYMIVCFGCLKREVLFCQASMKIKMSPLSVHC